MNTLIYFNRPDCPENIGVSQLTDNVQQFLDDRTDYIKNPILESDRFTFDCLNAEGEAYRGFALLFQVPENFYN